MEDCDQLNSFTLEETLNLLKLTYPLSFKFNFTKTQTFIGIRNGANKLAVLNVLFFF